MAFSQSCDPKKKQELKMVVESFYNLSRKLHTMTSAIFYQSERPISIVEGAQGYKDQGIKGIKDQRSLRTTLEAQRCKFLQVTQLKGRSVYQTKIHVTPETVLFIVYSS